MTVLEISTEFGALVLDERNHRDAPKTPVKQYKPASAYQPVSPYSEDSDEPSLPMPKLQLSPERRGRKVAVSEHKRAELGGRFLEE